MKFLASEMARLVPIIIVRGRKTLPAWRLKDEQFATLYIGANPSATLWGLQKCRGPKGRVAKLEGPGGLGERMIPSPPAS